MLFHTLEAWFKSVKTYTESAFHRQIVAHTSRVGTEAPRVVPRRTAFGHVLSVAARARFALVATWWDGVCTRIEHLAH